MISSSVNVPKLTYNLTYFMIKGNKNPKIIQLGMSGTQ